MKIKLDKIKINELKQIWKGFKAYALDNCIDLTIEDDYGEWWNCYIAGYKRCDDLINETIYPPEYNSKVMLSQLQQALKTMEFEDDFHNPNGGNPMNPKEK